MKDHTDRQKACIDRPATQHVVKCWPEQFALLRAGVKRFEYRKNDRDYRAGDTLKVCEYDPNEDRFSGQSETFYVPHVLDAGFGLPVGYCVLSLESTSPIPGEPDGGTGDVAQGATLTLEQIKEVWERANGEELENTEFGAMVVAFAQALTVPSQPAAPADDKCATCNGHGMIGGPSYYAPDEGGDPCPDCAAPSTAAQGVSAEWLRKAREHNAKLPGKPWYGTREPTQAETDWYAAQEAAPTPVATAAQGATLTDAVRMLEGYAESYDLMARMDDPNGNGTVQCRSVAYDIRHNMAGWIKKHIAAPTPVADSGATIDEQITQKAHAVVRIVKEIVREKPTAKNAYGLKCWQRVEDAFAGALAADYVAAAKPVSVDAYVMPERSVVTAPMIDACALMIKGICMTHPQDAWTAEIKERICYMLKTPPTESTGEPNA